MIKLIFKDLLSVIRVIVNLYFYKLKFSLFLRRERDVVFILLNTSHSFI